MHLQAEIRLRQDFIRLTESCSIRTNTVIQHAAHQLHVSQSQFQCPLEVLSEALCPQALCLCLSNTLISHFKTLIYPWKKRKAFFKSKSLQLLQYGVLAVSCPELTLSHPVSVCPAALQALKRKKRYQQQLAQIDGTLSTIEFQREALENSNTNTEVLKTMSYAAKAMQAAHQNM